MTNENNTPTEDKKTIVVWFSCGAASAVAAKETLKEYGHTHIVRIVNNPVIEEGWDNRRFLEDVENWLGVKIEICTNPNYPSASASEVWEKRKYMEGIKGAPCTFQLKKKARQYWEDNNIHDYIVMGFHAGEERRSTKFQLTERSNLIPILIDKGITKDDCLRIIEQAGIKLPVAYSLGFKNANCMGCVKATSPKYWNLVRQVHPSVFHHRAEQSRRIGAKLVRVEGQRVFLDELPTDSDQGTLDIGSCGIFCEEDNV